MPGAPTPARSLRAWRRARLAGWAINFCALAALLVCVLIAALFMDAFLATSLRWLVAILFVATMVALIGGIMCFLREVYVATHALHFAAPEDPATRAARPGPT